MPKSNPFIDMMDRENRALRNELARLKATPTDCPIPGCCDHACDCVMRTNVGTNGGCQCDEQALRRALRWWRSYLSFQRATIDDLRRDIARMQEEAMAKSCQHAAGESGVPRG
jgi:hypothetical protein